MTTLIDIPVPSNDYELAKVFNIFVTSKSKHAECDSYKVLDDVLFIKEADAKRWSIGSTKHDPSNTVKLKVKVISQHYRKSGTARGINVPLQYDERNVNNPSSLIIHNIGASVPKSTTNYSCVVEGHERTVRFGDLIWAPSAVFADGDDKASVTVLLYVKR